MIFPLQTKAKARRIVRTFDLQKALGRKEEPAEAYVLATADGRTLDILPDKSIALDAPKQGSEYLFTRVVRTSPRHRNFGCGSGSSLGQAP